jgi:hypothetical protein
VAELLEMLEWEARSSPEEIAALYAAMAAELRRDVYQAFKHTFGTVDQLVPVLRLLSRHGYLARVPRGKRTGRPSEPYQVNPLWNLTPPAEHRAEGFTAQEDPTQNPQNTAAASGQDPEESDPADEARL